MKIFEKILKNIFGKLRLIKQNPLEIQFSLQLLLKNESLSRLFLNFKNQLKTFN
jgi:hypothetical protein